MSDPKFFPPQQNPLLTRFIQSIFYLVAYLVYKIRLVIEEEEVAKLKAIADQPKSAQQLVQLNLN
ncbi:MAG: hypothetical protein WBM44_19605 [Waterburya sp.]